jgi:gamma-glutamyltranspeptidase
LDRLLRSGRHIAPGRDETFRQKRLGETLRRIAAGGATEFYEGEIAKDLVSTVQDAGGLLSTDDLRCVAVEIDEPLCTVFRGLRVFTGSVTFRAAFNASCGLNVLITRSA